MSTIDENATGEKTQMLEYSRLFENHKDNNIVNRLSKKWLEKSDISRHYDIYTTRFTSDTYYQNNRYRDSVNWDGALYGSMVRFPENTPDKLLFILDMNNTTNKIMGIGLMVNKLARDQSITIYSKSSFNNYIYKSKYYIQLVDVEYQTELRSEWTKFIEEEFEGKLFYTKSNSKRGCGFMAFPRKFLRDKHIWFLVTLFAIINPNDFVKNIYEKVRF